jgi:hypothetical protein
MVTINGVGGIPEPAPERPANVRDRRDKEAAKTERKDDIVISSEAQAAADLARAVQVAKAQADMRAEKIAAAREHLEREDYKKPEVVAKVAERVSKYLP